MSTICRGWAVSLASPHKPMDRRFLDVGRVTLVMPLVLEKGEFLVLFPDYDEVDFEEGEVFDDSQG